MAVKRVIEIDATTGWKLRTIVDYLIKGIGWKGFYSGIGSKEGKVKVTVIVERIK